jgi:hypothetical protein
MYIQRENVSKWLPVRKLPTTVRNVQQQMDSIPVT